MPGIFLDVKFHAHVYPPWVEMISNFSLPTLFDVGYLRGKLLLVELNVYIGHQIVTQTDTN